MSKTFFEEQREKAAAELKPITVNGSQLYLRRPGMSEIKGSKITADAYMVKYYRREGLGEGVADHVLLKELKDEREDWHSSFSMAMFLCKEDATPVHQNDEQLMRLVDILVEDKEAISTLSEYMKSFNKPAEIKGEGDTEKNSDASDTEATLPG